MPTSLLENHLQLLRQKDPGLADRLDRLDAPGCYEPVPSRQGMPTLIYKANGPCGRLTGPTLSRAQGKTAIPQNAQPAASTASGQGGIALHSRYDPVHEAEKFIQQFSTQESAHYLVLGLGLGYHVLELIRRIPSHSQVVVVEADPALFRTALEHAPLAPLLRYPGIKFWVGLPPEAIPAEFEPFKTTFTLNGFTPVRFQPAVNLHRDYYAEVEQRLARQIREAQVVQNTQAALSRSFYQNLLTNLPVIETAPGIDDCRNRFCGVPAIVVSAGPSLDKNLPLLQGANQRALILAVATAIKPLAAAGIVPDFVVAIDPNDISIAAFEAGPPSEFTHLVFHPCIPPEIVQRFPGRRVVSGAELFLWEFVSQGLENKGSLGKSYSVAHTALKFANHLGCSPVVLVGQDLAFAGPRSHCSGSHHADGHYRDIGPTQTARQIDQFRRRASAPALHMAEDVFGNRVATNLALDTFRKLFAEEIVGKVDIFNATEGGLPLPGALNMTLREALNRLPEGTEIRPAVLSGWVQEKSVSGQLNDVLLRQARYFGTHAQRIQDWLDRHGSASPTDCETHAETGAREVLDQLLADSTSVRLLQEFLYTEFLDWNRKTYRIGLLNPEHEEEEIRSRQLGRDRWFFPHLVKAAWWLESELTRLAALLA